jgi:hypothetical protein
MVAITEGAPSGDDRGSINGTFSNSHAYFATHIGEHPSITHEGLEIMQKQLNRPQQDQPRLILRASFVCEKKTSRLLPMDADGR